MQYKDSGVRKKLFASYGLKPKKVSQSEYFLLFHFASAAHAEEPSLAHSILEHLHTEKLYDFGV